MTVRERMEQEEYDVLSPQAQKAAETKGRPSPEEDNDVRTCYQRDADRILHSKSFRREPLPGADWDRAARRQAPVRFRRKFTQIPHGIQK